MRKGPRNGNPDGQHNKEDMVVVNVQFQRGQWQRQRMMWRHFGKQIRCASMATNSLPPRESEKAGSTLSYVEMGIRRPWCLIKRIYGDVLNVRLDSTRTILNKE